jgi:excinuclease ABC subunit A
MVDIISNRAEELKEKAILILSPIVKGRKGEYYQLFYDYLNLGFGEVRIDKEIYSLHERLTLPKFQN